jgi:hypothetical protein
MPRDRFAFWTAVVLHRFEDRVRRSEVDWVERAEAGRA